MIGGAESTQANWAARLIGEPLGLPQFGAVSLAALFVATLYCQIYCAVAFQPMQGMHMPAGASLAWAVTAVMPWIACVEVAKRRRSWAHSQARRWAVLTILYATTAAVSIVLERGLDQLTGVHQTRPLPMQAASQLSAVLAAALIIFVGPRIATRQSGDRDNSGEPIAEVVALAARIRWIEAAGNYVQVHTDRGVSLHRVTMRQLEQTLDSRHFCRIHRSVIVNVAAIESRATIRRSAAVRMIDGTVLKVGSKFAAGRD